LQVQSYLYCLLVHINIADLRDYNKGHRNNNKLVQLWLQLSPRQLKSIRHRSGSNQFDHSCHSYQFSRLEHSFIRPSRHYWHQYIQKTIQECNF